MRSIELFSGCGGLALGTARAGFHHVKMVEWNKDAYSTLVLNKHNKIQHAQDWSVYCQDVRAVDWKSLDGEYDLVAGGPPCQPFSIGGKHSGKEDLRDMWPEAVRVIRDLEPKAFLFENVRGLARPAFAEYLNWIFHSLSTPQVGRWEGENHASHLERLRQYASRAQYDVMILKLNAADYGAAQKRHRIVFAGVHRDLGLTLNAPTPTHSRERLLWDQWVEGSYWVRHNIQPNRPRQIAKADETIVRKLETSGNKPKELPWRTVRDALLDLGEPSGRNGHCYQAGARIYPGHTGSPLDEPAKALKAGDHGVPGGENMMVRDDGTVRYFTIREAARLQGFPDDWQFASSWTECMRQLGNAVPVPLAHALGAWVTHTVSSQNNLSRAA